MCIHGELISLLSSISLCVLYLRPIFLLFRNLQDFFSLRRSGASICPLFSLPRVCVCECLLTALLLALKTMNSSVCSHIQHVSMFSLDTLLSFRLQFFVASSFVLVTPLICSPAQRFLPFSSLLFFLVPMYPSSISVPSLAIHPPCDDYYVPWCCCLLTHAVHFVFPYPPFSPLRLWALALCMLPLLQSLCCSPYLRPVCAVCVGGRGKDERLL